MSDSETPAGLLLLGGTPATEIFLVDHQFRLVARGLGVLSAEVPAGFYKLKFRLGSTLHEQLIEARQGQLLRVEAPLLLLSTAAPLVRAGVPRSTEGSSGEAWQPVPDAHLEAARRLSHAPASRRAGKGSWLFLMVRAMGVNGRAPGNGLSLHTVDGDLLVHLAEEPVEQRESTAPWRACHLELNPGSYLLRLTVEGQCFERVIVTTAGWQTLVFLLEPADHPLRLLDFANASLFMTRPQAFEPDDAGLLLTEVIRQGLAQAYPVISLDDLTRLSDAVPAHPMLALYAAHAALAARFPSAPEDLSLSQEERGQLSRVVSQLSEWLGGHPDVRALALALRPAEREESFQFPPMLSSSWPPILNASRSSPGIVPLGSKSADIARKLWAGGTWLIWEDEPQPPVDTFQDTLRLQALRSVAAQPSRVPAWAQPEAQPRLEKDPARLVTMLGLPSTVAQATVLELKRAEAQRLELELSERRRQLESLDRPLCVVLIPLGVKLSPVGGMPIDFDRIYRQLIAPAVSAAGMVPVLSEEEWVAGSLSALRERFQLFDFMVADLTLSSPRVLFEFGARQAARAGTTVALLAMGHPHVIDTGSIGPVRYELSRVQTEGSQDEECMRQLRDRLSGLRSLKRRKLSRSLSSLLRTHTRSQRQVGLRARLLRAERAKVELARARASSEPRAYLQALSERLLGPDNPRPEAGVLKDLLLSFRAIESYEDMVSLGRRLPRNVLRSVVVREQLAFALNRVASKQKLPELRQEAIHLLEEVLAEQGPNGETCGLLGRVYKDCWEEARDRRDSTAADRYLDLAIMHYVEGFEASPLDGYPGVNAVTLLEVRGDSASLALRDRLLPLVRFAIEQSLRHRRPTYWDHATLLELEVLRGQQTSAEYHLAASLSAIREPWQPKTTARNLQLIAHARRERKQRDLGWIQPLIEQLDQAARSLSPG